MAEEATKAPATTQAQRPAANPPSKRPGKPMGRRPRRKSRFGVQMEEKQNLKGIYGIREKQLRRYYREALVMSGETGPEMISLLEQRLDNALYRAGFAQTRKQARQIASHRIVEVNGQPVNVPSYQLSEGDEVKVKKSKQNIPLFENLEKHLQNVAVPSWLKLDGSAFGFRVTGKPDAEEANVGVDIRAIVEYFAR